MYYKNSFDNGYCKFDLKRFGVLTHLNFKSVLDVGSGSCVLQTVLLPTTQYEAVDVRQDALSHCNCVTYTTLPNKTYDLVCFFGSLTIGKKENLLSLLYNASLLAKKYLVFSFIKKQFESNLFTGFDIEEIITIIDHISPSKYSIDSTTELTEYIIICEI